MKPEDEKAQQLELFPAPDNRTSSKGATPYSSPGGDSTTQAWSLLLYLPIARIEFDKLRLGESGEYIFQGVDTLYLSFSLLDFISDQMDVHSGASREDTVHHLIQQLAISNPEKSSKERASIAGIVFDAISNEKNNHKMFQYPYFNIKTKQHLTREFRLIRPRPVDEQILYRVTKEGFTAYFSLLEVDSMVAHEVETFRVKRLLESGRYEQARANALTNKKRAIELKSRVVDLMYTVLRNPRQVNYEQDVKPQLEEAREHLALVQKHDDVNYKMILELKTLAKGEPLEHLIDIKNILESCFIQYSELAQEISTVNSRYVLALSNAFAPLASEYGEVNLEEDIFLPLLRSNVDMIFGFDSQILAALTPFTDRAVFDPFEFVTSMDESLKDYEEVEEVEQSDEITEVDDTKRFTPEMHGRIVSVISRWVRDHQKVDINSMLSLCEEERLTSDEMLCVVYHVGDLWSKADKHKDSVKVSVSGQVSHPLVCGDNITIEKV